ncbi:MAG: PTS glucose transporter subunit IIA [Lachnospiraceae bacterium]|nr:PTS glucose transporter subunit IIA [Lachnospiraceae bacterium]
MKDKIFGVLQRVGRSFMLPIAILPVAGLLLGIGGSLTNTTMLQTYGLMDLLGPGTIPGAVFTVLRDAGDIIFANLPILFAIGVAIGMAKREREVAALAAVIAFFIMHASIGALIAINGEENLLEGAVASVCGITSLQMGVFGGMIVGLGVAALHNRFYKIELPQVISFFGGTRFVPIICALVYTLVGIVMFFLWPPVQRVIYAVGDLVMQSGYFGTWIYGLMERLLIPFGLHHVFYLPFWQTALGGTMEIGGRVVEGAQNIFFAQLADPSTEQFSVSATRFMSGKFPLMIFGLPGAALAMYHTAKPEHRKKVGGLLLSAAVTSMLTGITEPLEFTFLFVAPLLYGIHCVFAGLAYMLMHVFEVGVGMTFSGGLIDLFLFGILQGNAKTNWLWIVVVGIGYFAIYYFLFRFLIRRFDLKTPGRGEEEEVKLYRRSDVDKKAENRKEGISGQILEGLGGRNNISDIDCCATRLRCTVKDAALVKEALLKNTGASGVIQKGNGVQIIYGPKVTVIKSALEDYMENGAGAEPQQEIMPATAGEQKTENSRESASDVTVYSPVSGTVKKVSATPDKAFADGLMGDGVVIFPEDGKFTAPVDGEITFVTATKHAVGMKTAQDIELLLHVGIDSVKMEGKGLEVFVKAGQFVKKGELLIKADLEYMGDHAASIATPVLCTNLKKGEATIPVKEGKLQAGEPLFVIRR